jgi:hypothetical protein
MMTRLGGVRWDASTLAAIWCRQHKSAMYNEKFSAIKLMVFNQLDILAEHFCILSFPTVTKEH